MLQVMHYIHIRQISTFQNISNKLLYLFFFFFFCLSFYIYITDASTLGHRGKPKVSFLFTCTQIARVGPLYPSLCSELQRSFPFHLPVVDLLKRGYRRRGEGNHSIFESIGRWACCSKRAERGKGAGERA